MWYVRKIMKLLVNLLDFVGKYGMIVICAFVITNAGMLERAYFNKYENAYEQLEREHTRQLVFGEIINSQNSWEKSGEALRTAYMEERSNREQSELNFQLTCRETYHLVRKLEESHPDVYKDVMAGNKFPFEVFGMFQLFDQMLDEVKVQPE